MPLSCSARCGSLRHRAGSPKAETMTAQAPLSREQLVVPGRAAGITGRASISIRTSRVRPPPPRRARQCPSRAQPEAETTTARALLSREQIVVPDRAAGFTGRASISICASRVRPPPQRRARRCPSRAQPTAAPCVTAPAHRKQTRRPRKRRRAASESSFLIELPASPSVGRSQSAPRACGRRRSAERADAPLVLSPLLLLASPRRLTESRHDDRASAAEPRANRRS